MNERIKELKKRLVCEDRHDFESLRLLVEVLRSSEGCPWDAEQTHASIRTDLIEETYEVIEAIDTDSRELMREELGDVLFQIIFHSRIEEENGGFCVDDVIGDIVDKMIYRHPHVFGNTEVDTSAQVLENWENLKKEEKSRTTVKEQLQAVPKQFPALIRTKKIVKKAAKNGYDFGSGEENALVIADLAKKAASLDGEERQNAVSEIIFRSVVLAGADADVEMNLGKLTDRFIDEYTEQ